jgi:phosphoglycerate dehydrogenase-like enzyme
MRRQVDRVWAVEELELGGAVRTLSGRHMVIVGLGSIGQEVARLASAFGLRVSGVRRQTDAPRPDGVEVVVPPGQLLQLLTTADVVVLAAPLTPATRGLLNRDALAACKRGAFLVNIGRGQLIDDEAVIAALNDGTLAGAALDVFAKEPLPPDSPYWDLPNTIVTPHVSGAMEDYWTPLVSLFAENLRRFEQGRPLLNLVDKRAGY